MKTKLLLILLLAVITIIAQEKTKTENYLEMYSGNKLFTDFKNEGRKLFSSTFTFNIGDTLKLTQDSVRAYCNSNGYFRWNICSKDYSKRISEGKLDLYTEYSYYSNAGTMHSVSTPGGSFMVGSAGSSGVSECSYYSKNKSELRDVSYSNLSRDLLDNPAAMECLAKYKTANIFKYVFGLTGVGIVVAGFASGGKPNMGTVTTGAVIANLSWIPVILQGTYLKEAINVYNK